MTIDYNVLSWPLNPTTLHDDDEMMTTMMVMMMMMMMMMIQLISK